LSFFFFPLSFYIRVPIHICFVHFREANIFQDGGGASDTKPLEGILSFGKGTVELDPFEKAAMGDDDE
jgi:hypothetical protein